MYILYCILKFTQQSAYSNKVNTAAKLQYINTEVPSVMRYTALPWTTANSRKNLTTECLG